MESLGYLGSMCGDVDVTPASAAPIHRRTTWTSRRYALENDDGFTLAAQSALELDNKISSCADADPGFKTGRVHEMLSGPSCMRPNLER